MSVEIIYPSEKYFRSFHEALGAVASEQIYLEMIAAPPFERVAKVQADQLAANGSVFYAVDGEKVVGWAEIFPEPSPRQAHRGGLGMACLPEYRGQGIGSKLLDAVLDHAKASGIEKVELQVYTSNQSAIKLYEKFKFETEGFIQRFRKLDDQYFDCLLMGKFL